MTSRTTELSVLSDHGRGVRSRVVREAAALFDRAGYHQTSMEDIAAAAGIRKPTLYHYFRGKHELLLEIHDAIMSELVSRLDAREKTCPSATEMIRGIVRDCLEVLEALPHYPRVFFEHYREVPEPRQSEMRKERDDYTARVQAAIANGVASGELREVDPTLAVFALFGATNWSYTWYRPDGENSGEQIADFIASVVIDGLVAKR